jgi:hypothetical protein
MPETAQAAVIATGSEPGTEPLSWEEVRRRFAKVYSTTSPGAAKARNLRLQPECSLAARSPGIDIVVEGPTSWVSDRPLAMEVAAAYDDKYSWPVTITDENMFDAPYGAPTAGSPPYRVYEVTPRLVYAFGTGDDLGVRSTRFRFTGI